MATPDRLHDLDSLRRTLQNDLTLPGSASRYDAPESIRAMDTTLVSQLFPASASPAPSALEALLAGSPEARQLFLASEVAALRKAREEGADQVHPGPFDVLEAIFPVRVRGCVLHAFRSGPFRRHPFSGDEIADLAALSRIPAQKAASLAAHIPVYGEAQEKSVIDLHRRIRDLSAALLEEHARACALARSQSRDEYMSALGCMAEGMATHLSNILSIILGYSSLVVDREQLDIESAEALRKVTEAAQKGRRFTEEMLQLAGDTEEERSLCSLHERIRGVISLLAPRLSQRVKIETRLEAGRDGVMAPPGVVHHIVLNLLSTAVEGAAAGSVVTVATSNTPPEGTPPGPEMLRISVTERPPSGAGAGAHVMKAAGGSSRLVNLHGYVGRLDGSVKIDAEAGAPPRLEVFLPAMPAESAPSAQKQYRRRLAASRIWVVDDDKVVREMCRRVLAEEGHAVEEIESCGQLNEKLRAGEQRPDLLIYDFTMPDEDGLELSNRLREEGIRTPIVLLSGFSPDQPGIKKALALRKTFYLQKPFTFRDISDMVSVALGETLVGDAVQR
jgi:CheY-like chemotaxis protein